MSTPHEPIAIVGIGCRFPGGVDSPETFWRLLRDGVDAIGEIPRDRFDLEVYYDPRPATPGKVSTRWGGFLQDLDRLDAEFFGIAPREAERLDPQQRLLLEVGFEALEDAGIPVESLGGSPTGVFIGMWLNDYEGRLFCDPSGPDFYMTTGSGRYSASGRLSYAFGLQGPSLTVDTACSSSLSAVHLACQSLWSGESTLALAGGANVILQPHISVAYSQSQMLSPDGRCKFGDARANGYVRSEGAGLVALKPLSAALRDGDRIYALILGGVVNNDGRTSGFMTTPGQGGQEDMLRRAYRHAGVSPGRVQYVEAHGTGTNAGDPVELGALGTVLADGRAAGRPCLVGSVKTNFGHTEGAAGVAGLIKAALALSHRVVPASLHFRVPNPSVPWDRLPLTVAAERQPWPLGDGPALAGVSAFGIAGTNAHVVLQEAPPVPPRVPLGADPRARLLPVSASSDAALRARVSAWRGIVDAARDDTSLDDVLATASMRRGALDHRVAIVGETRGELVERMDAYLRGEASRGVANGVRRASPRAVFVFPGQGSQWLGMGRSLAERESVFRVHLEECDAAIHAETGWSLLEELHADATRSRLAEIDVVQPTLFAIEVALAALWRHYGIEPAAVVGHSMGEVAAAHVGGILSLADAARVICRRSRLLRRTRGRGAMAVVELSLEDAARALAGREDRLSVAVSNSSRSTVLSGDPTALDEVVASLERDGVFCRRVNVDVASHSPQMEPLLPELLVALEGLDPRPAEVPLFSTVEARLMEGPEMGPAYWASNLRRPVLLSTAVAKLLDTGHDGFIEMSPHPILLAAIQQEVQLLGRRATAVPSLKREEPEQASILESLGALFCDGHAPRWRSTCRDDARLVSLPPYPWQRERFWYEAKDAPVARLRKGLIGTRVTSSLEADTHYWEREVGLATEPYLADHRVNGSVVMPAAAFLEMAFEAATDLGATSVELGDFEIANALVLPSDGTRSVQVAIAPGSGGARFVRISSHSSDDGGESGWTLHARALLRFPSPVDGPAGALMPPTASMPFDSEAHYKAMSSRGLEYGVAFRTVCGLLSRDDGLWARVAQPSGLPATGYRLSPSVLDGCLQVAVAALPEATRGETFVPTGVERLCWHGRTTPDGAVWARAVLRGIGAADRGHVLDIVLADEAGAVLLEVEGLRLVSTGASAGQAEGFFAVEWKRQASAGAPVAARAAGSCLVFEGGGGVGARLATALRSRGRHVVVAPSGDVFHAERLAPLVSPPLDAVVYLGSLDAPSPESGVHALAEARALTCEGPLRLVQALAQGRQDAPARLVLVSAGAQPVLAGEAPRVEQAPLWGFARVAANEHPDLRCAVVDLGAARDARDVDMAAEEVDADGPEDQVAIRSGVRYVARLAPADFHSSPPPRLGPARGRPFRASTASPGILDGLVLREAVRATPGPGQVEIEVEATGLNFMNVMSALGIYPGYPGGVGPLGIECAGRVSAIGDGPTGFRVGDEVLAVAFDCLATHAVADARLVRVKPQGLSFEEAAGVPIVFLTAHHALGHLARLQRGERVLVHAAAGGVGLAAIQLAERTGAEVFATAGSPEKRKLLESLGVRHVMDSRSLAFRDEVLNATGGEGVDVVLNSLAGEFIPASLAVLRPYGRFLEIGKRDIHRNAQIGLQPFKRSLSYFAIDLDHMARERPDHLGRVFGEVMELLERGVVKPVPVEVFPVSRVADAFRHMAQARHTGKIAISVRDPDAVVEERARERDFSPGTCLITGGLGALGLAVARRMVERGARHLALVGRTGANESGRAAVAALEASGASVRILLGDVSKAEDVKRVMDEVETSMPALSLVVHAAGLLDDGILLQQTKERFARVMAPKVEGAWNLHVATAGRADVDCVLFSSVASLLGIAGQANYAAGNAFLDALAHHRRARGLRATCVNFGPWADIGLAAAQANRGQRLAEGGLSSLDPDEGLAAFDRVLDEGPIQTVVMRVDWREYATARPGRSPFLSAFTSQEEEEPPVATRAAGDLRESLARAEPGGRNRLLETFLKEQVAQVLKQAVARIDVEKPFRSLGLDSLMGLELRNRLEAALRLTLPATIVWNYPTVAALVPHLAAKIGAATEAPSVAVTEPPADPAASEMDAVLKEIEQISAEEARKLLAEGS